MPEPFPKVVMNRVGERRTVQTFAEQDAAAKDGFLRSYARVVERDEAAHAPPEPDRAA